MIKLRYQDKCWIVANSLKVFGAPGFMFYAITGITLQSVHGKDYWSYLGVISWLVLIVPAFYAAKYAYKIAKFGEENYNEVISRQTRYRKSNVELHEMKYRFMMETFCYVFMGLFSLPYTVVWFIGFIIGK